MFKKLFFICMFLGGVVYGYSMQDIYNIIKKSNNNPNLQIKFNKKEKRLIYESINEQLNKQMLFYYYKHPDAFKQRLINIEADQASLICNNKIFYSSLKNGASIEYYYKLSGIGDKAHYSTVINETVCKNYMNNIPSEKFDTLMNKLTEEFVKSVKPYAKNINFSKLTSFKLMQKLTEQLKKKLPIRIDAFTVISNIKVDTKNKIYTIYEKVKLYEDATPQMVKQFKQLKNILSDSNKKLLKQILVKNTKYARPDLYDLIKHKGWTLRYVYETDTKTLTVNITAKDF